MSLSFPPPPADDNSGKDWPLAAVVGGVLAGCVFLIPLAVFILVKRRERLKQQASAGATSKLVLIDADNNSAFNHMINHNTYRDPARLSLDVTNSADLEGLAQLGQMHRQQDEVDRVIMRQQRPNDTDWLISSESASMDSRVQRLSDALPMGMIMSDSLFKVDDGQCEKDAMGAAFAGDTGSFDDIDIDTIVADVDAALAKATADVELAEVRGDTIAIDAAETRAALAGISVLVKQRQAAQAAGQEADEAVEQDLTRRIAQVRAGLSRIEEKTNLARATSDDWSVELSDQIARVRAKMRHVERADLAAVRWQTAHNMPGFASQLQRPSDAKRESAVSVANPLYRSG